MRPKARHILFRSQLAFLAASLLFFFLLALYLNTCAPPRATIKEKRSMETRR